MRPSRRTRWGLLIAVALAAAILVATPYVRGASLVVQAAGITGWPSTVASWTDRSHVARDLVVPWRSGSLRSRLYRPDGGVRRTVVLVPGVHAAGIDEPRLVGFARHLASAGLAVLTPELVDLKGYEVTPRATDMIEDAGLWASADPELAPDGKVGLMGISFGGGLSVAAAGRPALRDKVAFAFSFGGHANFPRVLRYLCTGILPDGSYLAPHDYGVVLILLGAADRLVPPDQAQPLRAAILTFLNASHLDMVDKAAAAVEFERARTREAELPEPARRLMGYVNGRHVKALGGALLPELGDYGTDPALSPALSPPPAAPVYLLHGETDIVIPAAESKLLAERLERTTPVHLLITPLITHAEIDRPAKPGEVWDLVRFWTGILTE
jgi:dienelactone hydrolase